MSSCLLAFQDFLAARPLTRVWLFNQKHSYHPKHCASNISILSLVWQDHWVDTMSTFSASESTYQAWSSTAPTYAANVGRTSALSASRLLELSDGLSRITRESTILDVGAGTGAVTFALASNFPSTKILAVDISAAMLNDIAAPRLPNVSTEVLDARNLSQKLEKESFSHVFSTFMLQTITTPSSILQEMRAVLSRGGVIGIGIWGQRNGPFEIWEQAARSLIPGYQLPEPFDDPRAWRTIGELEHALKEVGFQNVSTEEVKMPFEFESADSFVGFWFQAKNPAAVQCMSNFQGDMASAKEAVRKLVKEKYANGREIYTWAVLGIGRK